MKVLMFDFRESEKEFFKKNIFADFEIKFYEESLNEKTKLSEEEFYETDVVSVYRSSILTAGVLKKFKNLRTIATRSFNFSHIDLEYCKQNHIAVLNAGQYGDEAVAQYIFSVWEDVILFERILIYKSIEFWFHLTAVYDHQLIN